MSRDVLEPHKGRELRNWDEDEPDIIVDVTPGIERQIAALVRHQSQVPGFNVPEGATIGERVKKHAAELAAGYGFEYGGGLRRPIPPRQPGARTTPRGGGGPPPRPRPTRRPRTRRGRPPRGPRGSRTRPRSRGA